MDTNESNKSSPRFSSSPWAISLSHADATSALPPNFPRGRMEMDISPETLRNHTASRLPHTSTQSGLRKLHATSVSEVHRQGAHTANNVPNTSATTVSAETSQSSKEPRQPTFPSSEVALDRSTLPASESQSALQQPKTKWNNPQQGTRINNGPALSLRNHYPPLSMITQGYYDAPEPTINSTTTWVAQQSISLSPPTSTIHTPPSPSRPPLSRSSSSATAQPLIKPIRGFKPSRGSLDMASRRFSYDPDSTLRQLEGYNNLRSPGPSQEQDSEQNSDESDLFLRAAREEEELDRQAESHNNTALTRSDSRKVRIGQGASRPHSTSISSSFSQRRGSDEENPTGQHVKNDREVIGQALSYRPPGQERPSALDDGNRNRFYAGNSRFNPNTPSRLGNREISPPESQASYGSRRPSVTDAIPARINSYRQSNLSYSTPRTYNSSPLVSRTVESYETSEVPRAIEGTESTVSTTAPSTVWDELEDLKSRINRLELGKPSGGATSRASNERPTTATTTGTSMSLSPKRQHMQSTSLDDQDSYDVHSGEAHPLLHAALEKSKPVLSPEIYKSLDAAISDALSIASMTGSYGPPISGTQSTVGGSAFGSDRQIRRKADSMCRSLTELCLALTEGKANEARPVTRETEKPLVSSIPQRQRMSTELARAKTEASPRGLSRLEARRSTLLAGNTLPSPRFAPLEASMPSQPSSAGRRTSFMLRSRRAGTEEPEEDDDARFRTPSRATTEVGRIRNSPREYTSHQPLPERSNSISTGSALPVRRHYVSTSLTNPVVTPIPPVSTLSGRRFLDRSALEGSATKLTGRLTEERGQKPSSIGQGLPSRINSLNRRSRQSAINEGSTTGQVGGYQ